MMNAKPIETEFAGYRFRSRLEARYAVFFEHLGWPWEYEREGFDLGGVKYLPDFWLPQLRLWGEVKPAPLSESEIEKCRRLVWGTECNGCALLVGVPESKLYEVVQKENGGLYLTNAALTNYHNYPQDEGRIYYEPSPYELEDFRDTISAANAARAARFEFGETPR